MYRDIYRPWAAVGVGAGVVFAILAIVAYVLSAYGLMKLAQNKGIDNAWLAWIPIGNLYILGKIVEKVNLGSWEIPKLELVLPLAIVAMWILNFIPVIRFLAGIAFLVLMVLVLYKLFTKYRPEQAVLYTVLSIVLGLFWLFIFIIREDKEVA